MKRLFCILCLIAISAFTMVGCISAPDYFLFGITELELVGGDTSGAEREILDFLAELESQISTTREQSEVYKSNKGESTTVGGNFRSLFELSSELYAETGGAFNAATFAATKLWGFSPGDKTRTQPPSEEEITAVLPLLNFGAFSLDDDRLCSTTNGTLLDFGAIAKGYALDRAREIAIQRGVTSGKIDIGGGLCFIGSHPENRPYRVGVISPRKEDGLLMTVQLSDMCVSTSSDSERYFLSDGKRYHHIIDSKSAQPADNGIMSVTIFDKRGYITDAYSTAVFVIGVDEGRKFLESKQITAVVTYMSNEEKCFFVTGDLQYSSVNKAYRQVL